MNRETSPTTSVVIYVGSLLFAMYFVASAAYLWVYRSFFENYTRSTKADSDAWKKHFWNHDYDRTQNENWRLLLTVVILGLLTALFFGLVAWGAYNFMKNFL